MDRRLEHIKMVSTIHPHRHTTTTKCSRQRHQVNLHIMDHQSMRTVIRTISTAATETVTMAAINRSRHTLPATWMVVSMAMDRMPAVVVVAVVVSTCTEDRFMQVNYWNKIERIEGDINNAVRNAGNMPQAQHSSLDLAGSREQRGSAFELYRKPQLGNVPVHHHNIRWVYIFRIASCCFCLCQ